MMHPRSVAVLRRLSIALGFQGEHTGRLYISRSDAGLRRLANEDELIEALTKLSFRVVRLTDLPGEEQMKLVSNALCVVAPHGMGMTHLALHLGKPTVVELFNPLIGSDAYAFMSRAYGFDYHPIVGEQVDPQKRDFVVRVSDVLEALATSNISGPLNASARS